MIISRKAILSLVTLLPSVGIFTTGIIYSSFSLTLIAVLVLAITNVIVYLPNYKANIVFITFQFSYCFFLVGRFILVEFFPEHAPIFLTKFTSDIEKHSAIALFLSLLAVSIGYTLFKKSPSKLCYTIDYSSFYIKSIRRYTRNLIYITIIPAFIISYERFYFVFSHGYTAYYVDFESSIPLLIRRAADIYEVVTIVFLSTMPSKNESKFIIIFFLLIGLTSLGYGQRNGFLLNLIFIIFYFATRDELKLDASVWLRRSYIYILFASLPFLVSFLLHFSYMREGATLESASIMTDIVSFIYSLGGSGELVAFAKEKEDLFPTDKLYSFGPIIGLFKDNFLSRLMFDTSEYQKFSQANAFGENSFSFIISYLVIPEAYLKGAGLGSSYVAELWIDFSYIGVFFGSLLYGVLLANILYWLNRSIWITSVVLSGATLIIYSPRAEYLSIFNILFSFSNLFLFLILHLLAKKSSDIKSR